MDVLELSTLLEIKDGIDYSIQQFEQRTFFCPILQFYLARRYRIDQWIEPAFRKLMELPVLSITLRAYWDDRLPLAHPDKGSNRPLAKSDGV